MQIDGEVFSQQHPCTQPFTHSTPTILLIHTGHALAPHVVEHGTILLLIVIGDPKALVGVKDLLRAERCATEVDGTGLHGQILIQLQQITLTRRRNNRNKANAIATATRA